MAGEKSKLIIFKGINQYFEKRKFCQNSSQQYLSSLSETELGLKLKSGIKEFAKPKKYN